MARSMPALLAGWGNHPVEPVRLYRPEGAGEIAALLRSRHEPTCLARGLGRSYGDTALNQGGAILLQTQLGRFIAFDPQTNVLECEAGTSLADIVKHFLPRGYFLPVTPGTKYVTVGGAIANDVHGKNHHCDGSFADHVLDFALLLASGEVRTCSRSENSDLFWATVGGIGLTGVILTARIRLMPVESGYLRVDFRRAANLEQALSLLAATESRYRYSVAWIDCLAAGASLGRSVLMLGDGAPREAVKADPLRVAPGPRLRMPLYLPAWALNPTTVRLFNEFYYRVHPDGTGLVHYDPFFYPLDAIADWNRMYGRSGFVQYQAVFPTATSLAGLTALLERLSRVRLASFLAVLKSMGDGGQGLLAFPLRGYTLALDIPVRGPELTPLLRELDQLVLRHGGRLYLAKDSAMSAETFAAMYPGLRQFQEIKRRVDPEGVFSSSMARRLGIVEGLCTTAY